MTNELIEMISTIGFPIIACLCLGLYISKRDNNMREDTLKDKDKLYEEISFNREVNKTLLENNKLLAEDIKIDLERLRKAIEEKH